LDAKTQLVAIVGEHEARLRLFCQVCRAVQHAHQKGVIHRDLKPSNILVLEEDGEPAPRIIDFGVAKATHQRLSELTMHTRFGLLIGTPAYMSPEQAEMSGLDIDTRSDVYSLGAVLYELLVGARPIAELDGTEGAYGDLQRIIRTVDPATPSARLTALGAAAEQCANNRAATVTALRSRLQGELEWIVLKALAKNPARRYQTALGMAEDIENHLAGRPVTAARDSFVYRARKFVRRHRTAFSAAAVVFIALVGGMLAATAGLLQASRERDAAEQARLEAESVTGFFTDMLAAVDPERQGRDVPVRVVLDEAARTIDDKFDGAPLTEARLLGTIGETYRALGRFDEAERHLRRRLALVEDHLPALHPDRLDAMHELGRVLQRQARHEEAEALFEKALQGRREVLGERHWQTLSSASNLAIIYNFQHRHPEAVAVLRELLAIETAMVGENDPRVLSTMHNLGTTLYKSGHVEEATTLLNTAVSGRERLLGLDHPGTIISKIVLGELYKLTGRNEEALRLLGEAVDAGSRSLGPDHPRTLLARHRLGSAVATAGDYAAGEQLLQQTLAARQAVLGPDHLETLITEAELGRVLWLQAKPEARDHLERAVERGAEQLPADDLHLARFRVFLAEQQAAVGQAESAEALLLRAHKAIGDETATLGPEARWVRNRLLETLAGLFEAQGRMQQASQYRSLLVAKD
ncbi:MAG: serine/threonine-protein kinase, partial [Pseudomonadota bacterium]